MRPRFACACTFPWNSWRKITGWIFDGWIAVTQKIEKLCLLRRRLLRRRAHAPRSVGTWKTRGVAHWLIVSSLYARAEGSALELREQAQALSALEEGVKDLSVRVSTCMQSLDIVSVLPDSASATPEVQAATSVPAEAEAVPATLASSSLEPDQAAPTPGTDVPEPPLQ